MNAENVSQFPNPNSGDEDIHSRLRNVELDVREIKTNMIHLATGRDIEKAKNSLMRWLIGTLFVALGALASIVIALK